MTTRADLRAALARPGPGRADADRPGGGAGDRIRPVDRFGGLLLILVITYLLSAFTEGGLVSAIQVVLFLGVVLLALRNGRLHRRTARFISAGLVLGTVVAASLQLAGHDTPAAGVAELWTALILLLSIILILRRVLARPEITVQSIYGAISAYMILGLMFAAVYAAVNSFDASMFFANGQSGTTQTFQYFSFTTLTTLGYGDYTAAGSGGQALAVLEAMAGQIFLATLVARLVAGFRGTQRGAARRARSQPAGAKRATARRASTPAMVRLRPPGAARRRTAPARRPGGRSRAGPGQEPGGPAARQDAGPG
jgi:Ion channel